MAEVDNKEYSRMEPSIRRAVVGINHGKVEVTVRQGRIHRVRRSDDTLTAENGQPTSTQEPAKD